MAFFTGFDQCFLFALGLQKLGLERDQLLRTVLHRHCKFGLRHLVDGVDQTRLKALGIGPGQNGRKLCAEPLTLLSSGPFKFRLEVTAVIRNDARAAAQH